MNLIANNCVGARLYEVTEQQFPNPFMWMTIPIDNYIDLMENYDSIDLNNPKFELEVYKRLYNITNTKYTKKDCELLSALYVGTFEDPDDKHTFDYPEFKKLTNKVSNIFRSLHKDVHLV